MISSLAEGGGPERACDIVPAPGLSGMVTRIRPERLGIMRGIQLGDWLSLEVNRIHCLLL